MSGRSTTRIGPRRRWSARATLLVIEGPRRPWWLPVAVLAGGITAAAAAVAESSPALMLVGALGVGVAALWTFVRMSQFWYYKSVARTTDFSRCIRCGYPMEGLESGVCPECGTDSRRLVEWAARATGHGG